MSLCSRIILILIERMSNDKMDKKIKINKIEIIITKACNIINKKKNKINKTRFS